MNKITDFSELLKTRNTDEINAFLAINPSVLTDLTAINLNFKYESTSMFKPPSAGIEVEIEIVVEV